MYFINWCKIWFVHVIILFIKNKTCSPCLIRSSISQIFSLFCCHNVLLVKEGSAPAFRYPWVPTFHMGKPETSVGNVLCAIPPRKVQKIWAMIWGHAIFPLFLVFLADLDILCSGSFYHQFVSAQDFQPGSLCQKGKHPLSPFNVSLKFAPWEVYRR